MKRIYMIEKGWWKTNKLKTASILLFGVWAMTTSCQTEMQEKELLSNETIGTDLQTTTEQDTVYMQVDQVPEPVGGMETLYKHIGENLKYPAEARKNGVQGKVYVQFVVEKDGSVTHVEILKHIGAGTDQAVLDVMKNLPKWNPGKNNGEIVRVKLMMPVTFKLG